MKQRMDVNVQGFQPTSETESKFAIKARESMKLNMRDLQFRYVQDACQYLPQVVPMNVYWKQIAGNFMYNWLKNFFGVQTDMIVEKCLEHLPILEIRMMLLDYERLLFRANEAQAEFHALSIIEGNALSIVRKNQPQQMQASD